MKNIINISEKAFKKSLALFRFYGIKINCLLSISVSLRLSNACNENL